MSEELISIVLEVMINNNEPMDLNEIVEVCGFDKPEVVKSLNTTVELGIALKIKEDNARTTYQLIKELKGIHVAKAAQLGIDICAFESFFIIDKEEKKIALELATTAEKIKDLIVSKRKPLLQKRAYFNLMKTDGTSDNLMLLLEASNMALYEYLEILSEQDMHLKLLMTMHTQAENSVRDYSESLK